MKKLLKGNEAIAEAAIQAGWPLLFRLPHYAPESDSRIHVQADAPGRRLLSAGRKRGRGHQHGLRRGRRGRARDDQLLLAGISLKQEGISYIVGAELPCVIVNMVRGGPGLGSIQPAQSDYYQATRGGGHGDYRMCVLAPSSVQEAVTLTQEAFDIADPLPQPRHGAGRRPDRPDDGARGHGRGQQPQARG